MNYAFILFSILIVLAFIATVVMALQQEKETKEETSSTVNRNFFTSKKVKVKG